MPIRVENYEIIDRSNDPSPFDDWVHVISEDTSYGGYEWDTFHGFYSPSTDAFYWHSGSGCSCNEWGDELWSPADFEQSKDKADMQRAFDRFRAEHGLPARSAIRDFVKP